MSAFLSCASKMSGEAFRRRCSMIRWTSAADLLSLESSFSISSYSRCQVEGAKLPGARSVHSVRPVLRFTFECFALPVPNHRFTFEGFALPVPNHARKGAQSIQTNSKTYTGAW